MAVNGILIALLSPWASRVTSTRDAGRTLAVAAGFVAVGYGAYAFCKTPLQFAGATAIWSMGEIVALPKLSALVASISPVDLRGRYQGLFSLSFCVALAAAPAIGGVVVARFGAHSLWVGVTVLSTLVAAAHLVAGRARRRAGVG